MDDSYFVTSDNLDQYTQEAHETYKNGAYRESSRDKKWTSKDTIKLGIVNMALPIVLFVVARLISLVVDIAAFKHFDSSGRPGHPVPVGTFYLAMGLIYAAPVLILLFISGIVLLIVGVNKSKKEKRICKLTQKVRKGRLLRPFSLPENYAVL